MKRLHTKDDDGKLTLNPELNQLYPVLVQQKATGIDAVIGDGNLYIKCRVTPETYRNILKKGVEIFVEKDKENSIEIYINRAQGCVSFPFLFHPRIHDFAAWNENMIEESTGPEYGTIVGPSIFGNPMGFDEVHFLNNIELPVFDDFPIDAKNCDEVEQWFNNYGIDAVDIMCVESEFVSLRDFYR